VSVNKNDMRGPLPCNDWLGNSRYLIEKAHYLSGVSDEFGEAMRVNEMDFMSFLSNGL
jgi:hypothetical protein